MKDIEHFFGSLVKTVATLFLISLIISMIEDSAQTLVEKVADYNLRIRGKTERTYDEWFAEYEKYAYVGWVFRLFWYLFPVWIFLGTHIGWWTLIPIFAIPPVIFLIGQAVRNEEARAEATDKSWDHTKVYVNGKVVE